MRKYVHALLIMALVGGICALFLTACSSTKEPSLSIGSALKISTATMTFDHSHSKFDTILKKHVVDGWVDYAGIIEDRERFYAYVNELGAIEADAYEYWTQEQKLAFWINAYNAFTIQAIIERYPIRSRSLIGLFFPRNSILQISGIWTRLEFKAVGQSVTLDHIEHGILRKLFDEPRIHFAIVCASRSCPDLKSEAYRADLLDQQLDEQTVHFINDPHKGVRWDPSSQRLYISKIFKWFKEDFDGERGGSDSGSESRAFVKPELRFILEYFKGQDLPGDRDIRISYIPYDWRLNEKAEKPPDPSKKHSENDEQRTLRQE